MKESVMSIRVIEPSDGYYLTRKDRDMNNPIILSKKVVLSAKDSADDWIEISEEEGDAIRRAEEEAQGIVQNL